MREFKRVYGNVQGQIEMKKFFDLLVTHELGHIIVVQTGISIPKMWFNEFFANYFLSTVLLRKSTLNCWMCLFVLRKQTWKYWQDKNTARLTSSKTIIIRK